MFIEAISICIDYSDFLEAVIPHNLPLLDRWTIVTTPADKLTQRLCAKWSIPCLKTNIFYTDVGVTLNKSRGICHGLAHSEKRDWLLHLDADIVLPGRMRQMLSLADINKNCIYGADRVCCPNYEAWKTYISKSEPQYTWHYLMNPPMSWRIGSRLVHQDYGGYVPIGYFQLWHSSYRSRYPIVHAASAEHTDVLHAAEWPRENRVLLPEFYVIHLDSGPSKMGVNWDGRKSPPFGPNGVSPKLKPNDNEHRTYNK